MWSPDRACCGRSRNHRGRQGLAGNRQAESHPLRLGRHKRAQRCPSPCGMAASSVADVQAQVRGQAGYPHGQCSSLRHGFSRVFTDVQHGSFQFFAIGGDERQVWREPLCELHSGRRKPRGFGRQHLADQARQVARVCTEAPAAGRACGIRLTAETDGESRPSRCGAA